MYSPLLPMQVISPFYGVRPGRHLVDELMQKQFDEVLIARGGEFSEDELIEWARRQLLEQDYEHPGLKHFLKVGLAYRRLIEKGEFIRDDRPNFYLIGVEWEDQWLYGLVGAVHYSQYWNGRVKRHEDTLRSSEEELVRITKAIDFNFNPVMLTYPDHQDIDSCIEEVSLRKADYTYYGPNSLRHEMWVIDDDEKIETLRRGLTEIDEFYVADGHHRLESGSIVARERKEEGDTPSEAPHAYFTSIFFGGSQLRVYEFNRLVKDLNGLSVSDFLKALERAFYVEPSEDEFRPGRRHDFGLYIDHKWYRLRYKDATLVEDDPVQNLDVSVLRHEVLGKILGIEDFRDSTKLTFLDGVHGITELIEQVDSGKMAVAFTLCPPKLEDMIDIARHHEAMPPKATCIEPKLKSGMISRLLS